MIPLLVITGPTGIGKSKLALKLAGELNGEIISADSRQVYKHFDIGTAKPTPEERDSIPHHIVDICHPDRVYSVSDFQSDAKEAISEIYK